MRGAFTLVAAACLLAALVSPVAALAEEKPETVFQKLKNEKNKDLYTVNIAGPTAAALSVVGAKDVAAIGADIAPDLYYHFTPKDDGLPEMALSVRPYWTLFNAGKTVQDYQDDKLTSAGERIFARTRVSLAAANNSDGKGFSLGAGLNTTLTGLSDPRSDRLFLNCVQTAGQKYTDDQLTRATVDQSQMTRALALLQDQAAYRSAGAEARSQAEAQFSTPTNAGQVQAAFDAALGILGVDDYDAGGRLYDKWEEGFTAKAIAFDRADYDACVNKATTRYQTRRAWAVGTGLAYRADRRDFDALEFAGISAWTTYKIPLFGASKTEKAAIRQAETGRKDDKQNPAEGMNWKGSLLLSARYISDDKIKSGTASEKASTLIAAAQFKASRGPLELSATAARYDHDFEKAVIADDRFARYSVTGKVPIGEGLAIDLSAGSTSGRAHKEDDFVIFRVTATGKALKAIGQFKTFLGQL